MNAKELLPFILISIALFIMILGPAFYEWFKLVFPSTESYNKLSTSSGGSKKGQKKTKRNV